MKQLLVSLLFIISTFSSEAKKLEGYFVTKKHDTIQATYLVRMNRVGEFDLKTVKRAIKYKKGKSQLAYLFPKNVLFVKIYDSINGDCNLYPIQANKKIIFAHCLVKGTLSLYANERNYDTPIELDYAAPAERVNYYIQLEGKQMEHSKRSQFSDAFWNTYLGTQYADFTQCLNWDKKKRTAMKKEHQECFWRTNKLMDIVLMFNEKYALP